MEYVLVSIDSVYDLFRRGSMTPTPSSIRFKVDLTMVPCGRCRIDFNRKPLLFVLHTCNDVL